MKKSKFLLVISILIMIIAVGFTAGCTPAAPPELKNPEGDVTKSVIHVLNTGWEDAIILESDGHYGLVDAGEPGRGQYVLNYLQRLVGEGNPVQLDFIIGTHGGIDHMGGMKYILEHENVSVDLVICKKEPMPAQRSYYSEVRDICEERNIPMLTTGLEDKKIQLGEMQVTLLNATDLDSSWTAKQTNLESICQLVEVGEIKALLAADMTGKEHEMKVYEKIDGRVDLLKVGHHGMYDSNTSTAYVKAISPKVAVYTNGNSWEPMSNDVMLGVQKAKKGYNRLAKVGTTQFVTTDIGGLKATFYTDGMKYEAIKEFSKKVTADEPKLVWEYRPATELLPIHKILENIK